MTKRLWSVINMDLLPIKIHYFFLYGAMAGVLPFMPVFAKGLGLSATAVGLIYTILPFCILLSKPLFGYISDLFRNIKIFLIILLIACLVSLLLMLPIPALHPNYLECSEEDNRSSTHFVWLYNACSINNSNPEPACKLDEHKCVLPKICQQNCNALESEINFRENNSVSLTRRKVSLSKLRNETGASYDDICSCVRILSPVIYCKPNNESCDSVYDQTTSLIYSSYNFWVFLLLAVISGAGFFTSITLSDAACCELLGDRVDLYGRQRLWATVGMGSITFVAGYFNDLFSIEFDQINYSPGFYLTAAMIVVDLIVLWQMKITKSSFSLNICQDVGRIFKSCEAIAFAVGAFLVGALTGLHTNYQFWFLQDLGANQTLLGLVIAFQCLPAEVPFLFYSGWFIRTFGHFYCLSASFAAFSLRLGLYYILVNPWLTLPIELLHGLTFATFYAAMNSYASEKAPPGTSATMLGVFGGLYDGLGIAVGSLLGGIGMDNIGGRNTFLTASIISLIVAPFFIVIHKTAAKHVKVEQACQDGD